MDDKEREKTKSLPSVEDNGDFIKLSNYLHVADDVWIDAGAPDLDLVPDGIVQRFPEEYREMRLLMFKQISEVLESIKVPSCLVDNPDLVKEFRNEWKILFAYHTALVYGPGVVLNSIAHLFKGMRLFPTQTLNSLRRAAKVGEEQAITARQKFICYNGLFDPNPVNGKSTETEVRQTSAIVISAVANLLNQYVTNLEAKGAARSIFEIDGVIVTSKPLKHRKPLKIGERMVKEFLGRPLGMTDEELFEHVRCTVLTRSGDRQRVKTVRNKFEHYSTGNRWLAATILDRIVRELRKEGRSVDVELLEVLRKHQN